MNSLIIKLHQKLVLVFILVLLNVESVFAQQNNNDSSLITETVSSVSSNIEEGYRPSYNLDNDTQVNSFLKEFENSNALIYQKLDELANDDELLNSSSDNEIVYQEGYADNQTSNSNQVNTEISNLIEELANDKALSGNIIYDEKKPLENISQLETNLKDLNSESKVEFSSVLSSPIEEIKISSIGIDSQKVNLPINSWGKTEIGRASDLLKNINPNIDSTVIKNLLIDLVSTSLEPPFGNSISDEEFLISKIEFLANAGETSLLREFVDLLPNQAIFDSWREWRVQDAFLQGNINADDLACQIVEEVSSNNITDFWQMAHVFCMVIQGNEDEAIFNAELLKASGIQDENFFGLFDSMLNRGSTGEFSINIDNLNLLHVAMMDQIRNTIPPDFLLRTPVYINKSLINIDNIQPASRAILLDGLVNLKLIDETEVSQFYEEIGDPSAEFLNAINTIDGKLGPQSRADLWKAINNSEDIDLINSKIIKIIAMESLNGRPLQALRLYDPLLKTNGSASEEEKLVIRSLKTINSMIFSNNTKNSFFEDFYEKNIFEILNMETNSKLDLNILIELNLLDTIPVLTEVEKFDDKVDALDYFLNYDINLKKQYFSNPLLNLSLARASNEKNLAEVILISTLMLKNYKLSDISPNSVLEIIRAFNLLGFKGESMDFAREWLACKLIQVITEPYLDSVN